MVAEFEDLDDVGLGDVVAGGALATEDGEPGNGEVEEGVEFRGAEGFSKHSVKRLPHAFNSLFFSLE